MHYIILPINPMVSLYENAQNHEMRALRVLAITSFGSYNRAYLATLRQNSLRRSGTSDMPETLYVMVRKLLI